MTESRRLAIVQGEEAPVAPEALDQLRRFHYGDLTADVQRPNAGEVPAALHPVRGRRARSGWPLWVDPAAADGRLALPAAEWLESEVGRAGLEPLREHVLRIEKDLVAALATACQRPAAEALAEALGAALAALDLPGGHVEMWDRAASALLETVSSSAVVVGFGASAPLALAAAAAAQRSVRARARLLDQTAELASAATALLLADQRRRGSEAAEDGVGGWAARMVDPRKLAEVVRQRRFGEPMSVARRARIEAAVSLIGGVAATSMPPLWVTTAESAVVESLGEVVRARDAAAAAAAAFDRDAATVTAVVQAVRMLRLELADSFDPQRHQPWLERIDWRSFGPEELALIRPVVLVYDGESTLLEGLESLTTLLRSRRPVQVLVVRRDGTVPTDDPFDPAFFAIGLREVFVHQGSLARPALLAEGLARGFAAPRTGVHVVDVGCWADDVDPWLVSVARLTGRLSPLLRWEPDGGASWARRLRCEGNPEPTVDWPEEVLPDAVGGGRLGFSAADAMLLDSSCAGAFAVVPEGRADELVPLVHWSDADPEAAGQLPFVWAVDRAGMGKRLVVRRQEALAALQRRAVWRSLQELVGINSELIDDAVARARAEVENRLQAEVRAREEAHAAELEACRAGAEASAIERVVAALFELEGAVREPLAPTLRSRSGSEVRETPPAAAITAPKPEPSAPKVEDPEPTEAWIDTALCTSCDECIRKSPGIFAYNANKQAYVKDPRGGSYRELVIAAEACTAKIIHPGTPLDPQEPDLDTWVARAGALG